MARAVWKGPFVEESLIKKVEKQQNQTPRIIIGATALTSDEEHKKCIDAGMNSVLHKPYKKENIYAALKKFIAISKVNS